MPTQSGGLPVALPHASASQPLVSIVTPVYNGERYLAECVESVLFQSYQNWEYVIADNASTDATFEIASAYARRDERIRVHRFETHCDVIANSNRSLALISGTSRYCKMICADDWLFPDCLEQMVALAEEHPSVGIVGSYRLYGDTVDLDAIHPSVMVVPGQEICRRSLLGGPYVFGSPTALLFRADIVRSRGDEFFDEARLPRKDTRSVQRASVFINFHADTEVCYELLRESDFGFVHQVLSYTRLTPETITSEWTVGVGTWLPAHLYTLLRYGPVYLEESEFRARVRAVSRRYAVLLLKKALKGSLWRNRTVRSYHREALERLRISFQEDSLRPTVSLLGFRLLLRI